MDERRPCFHAKCSSQRHAEPVVGCDSKPEINRIRNAHGPVCLQRTVAVGFIRIRVS
jgi:hypothetical protein